MKHTFILVISLAVLCTGFSACKGKKASPADGSFGKDTSYAFGMTIGSSLKADSLYPDWDQFLQGMKDVLFDNETRFTREKAEEIFYEAYNANFEKAAAERKQKGLDFLEENKKKTGIITTESGLQYEVITAGNGPKPAAQDVVRVHYKGTLLDGSEFDSSYVRGEPAEFPLDGVIRGWTEGIQLMSTGSKYRLFIPSDLGYGPQGRGQRIPPDSTLIFEVELLDIIHN